MGLLLTTARRTWLNRNEDANRNNTSLNNPLNTFGENLTSMHGNNSESVGTQANSRLNLINQLVTFNTPANRKSKSSPNGNLNDFQNVSFGSHFFLAGRKFKNLISQAQTFLFGDQLDLAFVLSHKPVHFPYDTSPLDVPSNYLQSLVNIRKDTLRLVKYTESNFYESAPALNSHNEAINMNNFNQQEQSRYNIEFVFDCDCDVQIRVHYFANEKLVDAATMAIAQQKSNSLHVPPATAKSFLTYTCNCARFNTNLVASSTHVNEPPHTIQAKCMCLNSDTHPIVYKKGSNILFKQPKHFIVPSKFPNSAWQFNIHANYYPIVIECIPCDERLRYTHAHVTLAYIEKLQTILSPAQVQINTLTAVTNETLTTMATNNTNTMPAAGGNNNNNNMNNAHNLSAKALSMGCISQINYSYQIKSIKQKQLINGVLFSLQEIYGIEKKCSDECRGGGHEANTVVDPEDAAEQDDDEENQGNHSSYKKKTSTDISNRCVSIETTNVSNDTITTTSSSTTRMQNECQQQDKEQDLKGVECVICMCETRDTLILPCRHLCLCKLCAMNLRVQSNNCPICRIPFIALIQVKLFKKREQIVLYATGSGGKRGGGVRGGLEDPNMNASQLPSVKLESLNNLAIEEDCDDENLSRIVATSLASGDRVTVNGGKLDESVIIQIRNKTVTSETDAQHNREVLMSCGTGSSGRVKKFSDIYECVAIYEAFNYRDSNLNNSTLATSAKAATASMDVFVSKKTETSVKKKKIKTKTFNPNTENSNEPSSKVIGAESNRRPSLNDQNGTAEQSQRLEQIRMMSLTNKLSTSQPDTSNVRSHSVMIGMYPTSSGSSSSTTQPVGVVNAPPKSNSARMSVVKVTSSPNGCTGVTATTATTVSPSPGTQPSASSYHYHNPGNYVSKSYVDLRRSEDISLDKLNNENVAGLSGKQALSVNKINCSRF